jgi:hypothetical protein
MGPRTGSQRKPRTTEAETVSASGIKPWQWVLVTVAGVVLAWTIWNAASAPRVPNPNQIIVADIETGKLYSIDTSGRKLALLPATNPETGLRTLYPVQKNDEGQWEITALLAQTFNEYEGAAAAVADRKLRIVNAAESKPVRLN